MNILIFSNMYLPHLGGVEMVVRNLAREFKKKGHEVSIVSSRSSRKLRATEEIDGIQVTRTYLGLPAGSVKSVAVFLAFFLPSLWMLFRHLSKKRPQVVNLHFVDSTGFYVLILKGLFSFPLVASIHGNDVQKFPKESKLLKNILTRVLKGSESITSCSQSLLDDACRLVPQIRERAVVMRNGVSVEEFDSHSEAKHDTPYLFSLGRFEHKKGFDVLIRAFARVSPRFSDLHLFLGGDGSEETKLRKTAADLRVTEKVRFLGRLERESVVGFFKGCEIFVLPSRIEPLGIVNLEAMAAGKAIVATSVDGVPEIIRDGENGLLVEPENEEQLAEAITRLLEDRILRDKIASLNYREAREGYSWERVADLYLQAYEDAQSSLRKVR
jgi:glycosyltransferase involved in cell wall biosynthesis